MDDIKRKPNAASFHNVHTHVCPECKRAYTCNCYLQPDKESLVCIDCERKE